MQLQTFGIQIENGMELSQNKGKYYLCQGPENFFSNGLRAHCIGVDEGEVAGHAFQNNIIFSAMFIYT